MYGAASTDLGQVHVLVGFEREPDDVRDLLPVALAHARVEERLHERQVFLELLHPVLHLHDKLLCGCPSTIPFEVQRNDELPSHKPYNFCAGNREANCAVNLAFLEKHPELFRVQRDQPRGCPKLAIGAFLFDKPLRTNQNGF